MAERDLRKALEEILRASQGNFDHLDGQAREFARQFNKLGDDVAILYSLLGINPQDASSGGDVSGGDIFGVSSHDELEDVSADDHHAEVHSITGADHSGFPGGTTTFLRADATFAAPASGGGQAGLIAHDHEDYVPDVHPPGKTRHIVTYNWMSKPQPAVGLGRSFYVPVAGLILRLYVYCDTQPSSTATLDLLLNSTSIFPSAAKPTLTAGNNLGSDAFPDTRRLKKGDQLTPEIENLGGISDDRISLAVVIEHDLL